MDIEQNQPIVDIDENSGFCFGVINAIHQAEKALDEHKTLYCLGDIVHNGAEMARLNAKGLITISYEQFKHLHDCIVLLRAHGEPPETYEIAKQNNIIIIDATCPVVLSLQKRIKEAYTEISKKNGQVFIFGKPGHAEVVGLLGQTDNNAVVISDLRDVEKIDFSRPFALFSQTTQDIHVLGELVEHIRCKASENKNDEYRCYNTICHRVSNRENDLKEFASRYDMIIFVSGRKSSNGKVLFDICRRTNEQTYFVSDIHDLEQISFSPHKTVGICGATSTPKWLMEEIAQTIRTKMN